MEIETSCPESPGHWPEYPGVTSVPALSSAHHRANDNLRVAGEPPVFSARRSRGELRPGSAALLTGVEHAGAGERRADEAAGAGDQHRLPLCFPARHAPMFPLSRRALPVPCRGLHSISSPRMRSAPACRFGSDKTVTWIFYNIQSGTVNWALYQHVLLHTPSRRR